MSARRFQDPHLDVEEYEMVYEICTYHVKENRQDEFEVLARELREYYRACEGVREAAYIRQACAAPEGAVTYVLYLVCSEGADTNILDLVHRKYDRRFSRCITGDPCVVVGEALQ